MAAFNQYGSASRISYENGGGYGVQQLPTGSCGFRDLGNGLKAPTCGCKSFWLSNSANNGHDGASQRAYCFCGHHACFHDAFSQQRSSTQASTDGAEYVPVQNVQTLPGAAQSTAHEPSPKLAGLGIQPGSSVQSQSINTRLFNALNAFARDQEDDPPSITTSKLPSTACPSVTGEQPRAVSLSRMLLEQRAQQGRSMGPPINIPYGYQIAASTEEYSATEVATPSARGTPDLRAFAAPSSQSGNLPIGITAARNSPARRVNATANVPLAQEVPAQGPPSGNQQSRQDSPAMNAAPTMDVDHMLRAFSRRIEVLENLSFSHVPVDVVEEKFELMDGRLLDLEQWREQSDRERSARPAGPSNAKRRRLLPTETDSFSSEGSFDSHAAAQTEAVVLATLAANSETGPRIDSLERRITGLEHASLPSFAAPWHVQVVLLPWGRALRGIWFSADDATQHSLKHSTQASEDWTGAQSVPKLPFKSSSSAWTTESIEAWADDAYGWLSPKACGPAGTVFQRLASRGLVQELTLTAPDSHHLLEAIASAFAPILRADDETADWHDRYHGLSEHFVPLRKCRKSSRLRFLSRAEMVTSATWSAGFVDSSVCMKVNDGQRRLYITTPDAYVQADREGWTWQELRQLPLFDASGEEQAAHATGSVIEACWAYNQSLDQPVSTAASFAASQGSALTHDCQQDLPEDDLEQPTGDSSRPCVGLPEMQARHYRTMSLPSSVSAAEQQRAAVPKRRVTSFETVGSVPMRNSQQPNATIFKRRRISSSPEAERRGVGFTPRMSREPPSPYTSEPAGEIESQGNASRRRGMTPFAYATPHSNSNAGIGRMDYTIGDGDTEPDTDVALPEDEWQGVADDPDSTRTDDDSAADEPDIEEENLQEGSHSYAA